MKISMGAAGRIVIPKLFRDRLRLREGSTVEIEDNGSSLVLRPVVQNSAIVLRDGLFVYVGEVPPSVSMVTLVEDVREERLDEISRQ